MPRKKGSGASAGELTFDMTPMIDVVFQLIIFFMVVLSFKKEEVEAGLVLPVADEAKPQQKEQEELFVVNVLSDKNRIRTGTDPATGLPTFKFPPYVLRGQAKTADDLKELMEKKAEMSKARTGAKVVEDAAVIIRGDRDTSWGQMFNAMMMCTEVGFYKVYLKTLTRAPERRGGG